MTKKFLTLLMLFLLVAISLVSCGSSSNEDDGEKNQADTEITEEEWNKMLSLEGIDSFTFSFDYVNQELGKNGKPTDEGRTSVGVCKFNNGICICDGTKAETDEKTGASTDIITFLNVCYNVSSIKDIDIKMSSDFVKLLEMADNSYSALTYDKDKKVYTNSFVIEDDNTTVNAVYEFLDNKLVSLTIEAKCNRSIRTSTWDLKVTFSNWNSTEFTIPSEIDAYISEFKSGSYVFPEYLSLSDQNEINSLIAGLSADDLHYYKLNNNANESLCFKCDCSFTIDGETGNYTKLYLHISDNKLQEIRFTGNYPDNRYADLTIELDR